jgi:hypothetical protein
MNKVITSILFLTLTFSLNSQNKRTGTIIKISGLEITVRNENPQNPFQMGETLRLLTGDESVVLRVVFPMQTSAKCKLISGSINSLKAGSVVSSGEHQSTNKAVIKPLTKLQPVKIESIKLDDFDSFLGFSKGNLVESAEKILGPPFIKMPTKLMINIDNKRILVWRDLTGENEIKVVIEPKIVNNLKIISSISVGSTTIKGKKKYYQDTSFSGTISFLLSKGIDDSKLNLFGTSASKIISIFGEPKKIENESEYYTFSYVSPKGTKILFRFYGHENLLHTIEIHF